jgi:Flp pilus assembly protein TadG
MRIIPNNQCTDTVHNLVNSARCRRLAFLEQDKGAILVEAAIVLPILVMMFVGMAEFSLAFTANRKVTAVASTVADLVAQRMSVAKPDLNDIVSVANSLLAPFPAAPLSISVASVGLNDAGASATLWSCSWSSISGSPNCTDAPEGCAATGATLALPEGILTQAGNSIIVVKATYTYTPPVGKFLIGGLTFQPASYFKPRQVPCVAKL